MNNLNIAKKVLLVIFTMIFLVGCGNKNTVDDVYGETEKVAVETAAKVEEASMDYSYEGSLAFTGLESDFEVAYNDIYAMEPITTSVKHIASTGEESNNEVTGILLETILAEKGLSQKDYTSVRFVAGDGYAIDVPAEIIMEKDIILAYEIDGEPLTEKKQPLSVAINDVRSMYFVANLAEIVFTKGEVSEVEAVGLNEIILMETATSTLNKESFTYYDSEDEAVLVADLFAEYVKGEAASVDFVASDGFEKSEAFNVVNEGYIKTTGEDAPLFTGLDLPIGMNVKYIMKMDVANISFMSVMSAMDALENRVVDDNNGVALEALVALSGIEGDTYTLTANDGYSVEISKDDLAKGCVYVNNSGTCTVKFDSDIAKNTKVKNLVSIKGNGSGSTTEVKSEETTENETADVASWTITFDGLSDGSFDMTSDKAQRKLELVSLHTERMKNDVTYPEDWEGYRLLDVLSFLRVEEFNAIVFTANDGYEVEITREQVDDETILAVVKDGEPLSDETNLVQLVQNTEFATTWVKGVAKVTVK